MAANNSVNGWQNLIGSGSPVSSQAGNLGDQYFDMSGFNLWQCTGTGNATTATWAQMNGGSSSTPNIGMIPVSAISVANYSATYANGSAGVGATLTIVASPLIIDLNTITSANIGSYYCFASQTSALQNGIYILTSVSGTTFVFTRASFYNTPAKINSAGLIFGNYTSGASSQQAMCLIGTVTTIGTTTINLQPSTMKLTGVQTLNFAPIWTSSRQLGGNIAAIGVYQYNGSSVSFSSVLPPTTTWTWLTTAISLPIQNGQREIITATGVSITLPTGVGLGAEVEICSPGFSFTVLPGASGKIQNGATTGTTSLVTSGAGQSLRFVVTNITSGLNWQIMSQNGPGFTLT